MVFFFFFQAEDGIRDVAVTGVQTCALPIYFSLPVHLPAWGVLDAPGNTDHVGWSAIPVPASARCHGAVVAAVERRGRGRMDRPERWSAGVGQSRTDSCSRSAILTSSGWDHAGCYVAPGSGPFLSTSVPPNKRLKLPGPAFKGIVCLCATLAIP